MAPFAKTSSSRRRLHDLAWLITAPLALVALIIIFLLVAASGTTGEWQLGAVFLVLFVAANATVLIFEVRRGDTILANVVDIPFVLALFYLPPVTLIVVRVLTAVIMQVRRKSTPVKFAFNVANLSAATSVAAAVVFAQGEIDPKAPAGWIVLAAGVFIASAVSLLAVVAVITITQGGISRAGAARTALPALAVSLVNVPVGLVVLMVVEVNPWSIILLAALAGFFALAYRSYASSRPPAPHAHRDLRPHPGIAETPHDGTLSDVLLSRVRSLFQAEYATLWLPAQGRFPEVLLAARYDNRGLLDVAPTPESLRQRVFQEGKTYAVGPGEADEALKAEIRKAGVKDAIVVPLRAGSAVIGTLEVAGRLGDYNHFTVSDVQLLETVAAHAAVAVENSRLVDRLRYDAYHDASHRPRQPPPGHRGAGRVGQRTGAGRGGRRPALRRRRPAPGQRVPRPRRRRQGARRGGPPAARVGALVGAGRPARRRRVRGHAAGRPAPRRRSRWPASCASRSATRWCSAR